MSCGFCGTNQLVSVLIHTLHNSWWECGLFLFSKDLVKFPNNCLFILKFIIKLSACFTEKILDYKKRLLNCLYLYHNHYSSTFHTLKSVCVVSIAHKWAWKIPAICYHGYNSWILIVILIWYSQKIEWMGNVSCM